MRADGWYVDTASKLQTRALLVGGIVASVVVSRAITGAVAGAIQPMSSAAAQLFLQTVLIAALYGVLAWRLVVVPMHRRRDDALARTVAIPVRSMSTTAPAPIAVRAGGSTTAPTTVVAPASGNLRRGHLSLVPPPG